MQVEMAMLFESKTESAKRKYFNMGTISRNEK